MPLSRIEIRRRATAFAKEWVDATDVDAKAKSFWDGFFNMQARGHLSCLGWSDEMDPDTHERKRRTPRTDDRQQVQNAGSPKTGDPAGA